MKIFDAHFHIIDYDYHVEENNGFKPEEFTYSDYNKRTKELNLDVQGGVIISGSFQGLDTDYLKVIKEIEVLEGKKDFVGIINLDLKADNKQILALNDIGITGARFNIFRGNSTSIDNLVDIAKRLYDLVGWHVEVQINPEQLGTIKSKLLKIPRLSIDHVGLRESGLEHLYELASAGVKIKASGFGRLDFDPMEPLKKLYQINENCLMFGTDLPSTRVAPEKVFSQKDIKKLLSIFSNDELEKVMYKNAYNWYIKRT